LAIVWALVVVLYPLHLQKLAYCLAVVMLGGALYQPAASLGRVMRHPARRAELRTGRLAIVGAVALAALVVILAWPVNYYVRAPLVVMPANAARIYSSMDGTIVSSLPAGERVSAGQAIAVLENPAVALEVMRLAGQRQEQQLRVEHLDRLRGVDPKASEQLPAARAVLASLDVRLQERQRDAERLNLTAPSDGVVIAVPRTALRNDRHDKLPTWSGLALDAANYGAQIEAGTLLCLVGDPNERSAMLLLEDTDASRLRPGQAVRMRLDQLPGQVASGTVVEVSRREADDEAMEPRQQDTLATLFAGLIAPGGKRSHYQVRVEFDELPQELVIGGRGAAKVAAERITLARSVWRFVARTFRLPL
jgi:putative peptide zinc metalloprotease protein